MTTLLELSEQLWTGEGNTSDANPMLTFLREEVADGVFFLASFGNVTAVDAGGEVALIDTGLGALAARNHETIRAWTNTPVHTAIYTHGHIDHVGGVGPFDEENAQRGRSVKVLAHEAVPRRFARYAETAGYNTSINVRQFGADTGFRFPDRFREPDETYGDRLDITVGDESFELRHGRGETDDATWVFIPQRGVLCTGDFFIWASPNAGNPQKVQRYAADWAVALREMAACDAQILLPGHGVPIVGTDRVRRALEETAELLDFLEQQTREMMNDGARLDDVIHSIDPPTHLLDRPYLRPVYDEPEFVIRNVWRLLGGWWDGNPATLHPAPEHALAREVADLAGGVTALADRALALADAGDLRVAGHLVEMAALAAPDDVGVHRVRATILRRRQEQATSLMAKGVYATAAHESEQRLP